MEWQARPIAIYLGASFRPGNFQHFRLGCSNGHSPVGVPGAIPCKSFCRHDDESLLNYMIPWACPAQSLINYTSFCRRDDECLVNYMIPWACPAQSLANYISFCRRDEQCLITYMIPRACPAQSVVYYTSFCRRDDGRPEVI